MFHFALELSKVVSDAIRRDVFEYVDATYEEPSPEAPGGACLTDIMDSAVEYDGGTKPFKALFIGNFLAPLVKERDAVRDGRSFGKKTKVSAIMYGPPGTSKTRLARMIADDLGWPLLALDPSHLTRRGLDNVHAETDSLFGRLRLCDQLVVLLDEFDEIVREREAGELTSRFLTTAMLPKIAALHTRRRIVYLVATNHLEVFDAAISRPGRFDVIVPLMPPTAAAKLAAKEFKALANARDLVAEAGQSVEHFTAVVGDLTYAEAEDLAEKLAGVDSVANVCDLVERAERGATLNRPVLDDSSSRSKVTDEGPRGDKEKDGEQPGEPAQELWKARIAGQRSKIRGLNL